MLKRSLFVFALLATAASLPAHADDIANRMEVPYQSAAVSWAAAAVGSCERMAFWATVGPKTEMSVRIGTAVESRRRNRWALILFLLTE